MIRMKFKANTRRRAIEYEKDWVKRWKANKTFEKSVENRSKDNSYVFYDGPPFISGSPHHGTLLSSIVKDAVPRYWTMKGRRVERVWGWDCHGLPAERFTEKKLGINSREEVFDYGLEKYIIACRNNMVQTSGEWEDVVDRIGRWVDFKGAYKTMDKDYMESVWWAFKELYDKGKIYEGEKVLMYCTLDATPLSKAEVTMDAGAYQDVTDPSVYVKFRLKSEQREEGRGKKEEAHLLAWTTTPWTLPANTAVAVNKDLTYVEVEQNGERLILAKELLAKVMQDEKHQPLDYEVSREFKGSELVGLEYEPLFVDRGENAHKVWAAPYVSHEDGTGIVHLAPAYGEEDFVLAKENGIPIVHTIDENGLFTEGDWTGENVWAINKTIAKTLHERGVVWKIDYIRHSYPHCHRCGTKLMYRAHPSWFMDIDGQREKMLEEWRKKRDEKRIVVGEEEMLHIVADWTGVPLNRLEKKETKKLLELEKDLQTAVIGQDRACEVVARALRRSRADLKDPRRPIGSFLFLGPTGVGKTLLARSLAERMFGEKEAVIQIDMSEYMEKFTVSRLIGSPPGYVGHDEGGQLTEAVRRRPYCVVLLDEVEKAHPETFDILLQVLDDGRLTDGQGRTVDFRNVILVMTSNLGSAYLVDPTLSEPDKRESVLAAVRASFKPEFLNRLDEVVIFDALSTDELGEIVELQVRALATRLRDRRITLEVTPAAREWLALAGYDPAYGARPLRRLIQREIGDRLSTMENREPTIPEERRGSGRIEVDALKRARTIPGVPTHVRHVDRAASEA